MRRISQIEVSQAVGDQHGQGVRLLPGGAPRAPDAQRVVPLHLLAANEFIEHMLVEKVELSFVSEEAGLVNCEVFKQPGQLILSLFADEQAGVAVERVEMAFLEPPLQTILQKMRAAVVK